MRYSGAGGKLIHEKNPKQKISWHCPFKSPVRIFLLGNFLFLSSAVLRKFKFLFRILNIL